MFTRWLSAVLLGTAFATFAPTSFAQYTTDWLANTYGTLATHVGNTARSMWVAPEGTIYTASFWDENEGGLAIYQNGQNAGSMGSHADFQGGAITGNATSVFAALGYSTSAGSGAVGRYDRTTHTQDLVIQVSVWNKVSKADAITGLATSGNLLYASDFYGNRVREFTTDGVWQRDISIASPGALALDSSGDVWIAQKSAGTITEFSPAGVQMNTIQMQGGAQPSALYFDTSTGQLMAGDEGPDQNIKIYSIAGTPALIGTFGVQGGYLNTTTGVKGQVGPQRFTRIVGIGKDSAGNLYVLNNPWGGAWDLGRNGGTDIHVYDPTGNLRWKLESLNFEGVATPDPATNASYFYSGTNIFAGTAGGTFVANTVDPFDYPSDPRLNMNDTERDEHFAQMAYVNGNRILVASGQNPPYFYFYHFTPSTGYVAIPDGSLPGALFNTNLQVQGGFCLDSHGDVWAVLQGRLNRIYHYPLLGFDANGKPSWGPAIVQAAPATVTPVTRIVYLPESDTMILAQGIAGSTDWTAIQSRIEVYHGWKAGNTTNPNPVINITSPNPKSITAAGNFLFLGYVHTVPNIDVFNLNTGQLTTTLINANPNAVDVGNDVDSMYGLRAYLTASGQYVITKDNYNGSSVIVHRWTP